MKVLDDYWYKNYCIDHCTICGNSGVIDSRGVKTAAGVEVGRRNWCICPNGQTMLKQNRPYTAEETFQHVEND